MRMRKIPAIRPPKGAIYTAAAFLATFVFWFTRMEPEPSPPTNTRRRDKQGTKASQ